MTNDRGKEDLVGEHRSLILMRHAKSDWSDESLSDHDRPLNKRGRKDAPRMAQWLESIDQVPEVILSSSSVRTRETVELMLGQWTSQPQVHFDESLYLSTPDLMLQTVRDDGGSAGRLMVLAHNPGVAHLVSGLSDELLDMPTAAIAIFDVTLSDWSQLRPGVPIHLVRYMRPKGL